VAEAAEAVAGGKHPPMIPSMSPLIDQVETVQSEHILAAAPEKVRRLLTGRAVAGRMARYT